MPNPRSNKNDPLTQLNNALADFKSANAALDFVASNWSVPDAPDQPPFIDALNNIKDQGQNAIDTAVRLLATMGK